MSLMKFNHQFPSLFDHFFENDFFNWSNSNYSNTNSTLPSVNIKENDDGFEVEMAAPGLNKKDFKIELHNDLLTISSEKKSEDEHNDGEKITRKEFSYQSFHRSFYLPNSVDNNKIKAKYSDGILMVYIPKKEEAKPKPPKQISIS